MKDLQEDNLQQVVNENQTVIVQYGAGWCGNCKIIKPKFKKFASEYDNAEFVYVDAEKLPESRKLAEVDNLPTFAAFKDGKVVKQIQTNKKDVLKDFIDEVTAN